MNINSAFPSKFLKAADLPAGRDIPVTMTTVQMETMEDGTEKPTLSFEGKERSLVLNKTNSATIAAGYGDETDSWFGRPLILFVTKTMYAGRMVDCIRVKLPTGQAPPPAAPAQPAAPAPPAEEAPPADYDPSEIPF